MYSMTYATNWADLMIGQLIASRNAVDPSLWGYACLCVGQQFEPVFQRLYADIHFHSGEHLQVFSLNPPPLFLVEERRKQLRDRLRLSDFKESPLIDLAIDRLERLEQSLISKQPPKRAIEEERLRMLEGIREGGIEVGAKTDFIFFDFHRPKDEDKDSFAMDIDIIAAMQSPVANGATDQAYVELFEKMGKKATKAYEKNKSVSQFVKSLSYEWNARISFNDATDIKNYIGFFMSGFGGKHE